MVVYIINFAAACFIGLIFILLGIHQCRSKSPVTMNTGEKPLKPEELSDVKAWNTGHGKALIWFGIMIAVTISIFPIGLNYMDTGILTIIIILTMAAEVVGLMVNHSRLERIYKIK